MRQGFATAGGPPGALSVRPLAGAAGLRLAGEIDLATRAALHEALDSIDTDGDVCLDVAELTFIDAAGVSAIAAKAAGLGAGRRLILRDPPYVLRRVVELGWGDLPGITWEFT